MNDWQRGAVWLILIVGVVIETIGLDQVFPRLVVAVGMVLVAMLLGMDTEERDR